MSWGNYFKIFVILISNLALTFTLILPLTGVLYYFEIILFLIFLAISAGILYLKKEGEEIDFFSTIFFAFAASNAIYLFINTYDNIGLFLIFVNMIGIFYAFHSSRMTKEAFSTKKIKVENKDEKSDERKDYVPRRNYFAKREEVIETDDTNIDEISPENITETEKKTGKKKETVKSAFKEVKPKNDQVIIEEIKPVDVKGEIEAAKELRKYKKKHKSKK